MGHMSGGPCEPNLVVLDSGCVLAVFRQNGDAPYVHLPHLVNQQLWKAVSCDGGTSFTAPARMDGNPPFSNVWAVWPRLRKLTNGALVLTSGRPTIGLWICTDGLGENWSFVNLAKVHNLLFPSCGNPQNAILSHAEMARCLGWPKSNVGCKDWDCIAPEPITNAYSSHHEIEPNVLLTTYDRISNGGGYPPGDNGCCDAIFSIRVRVEILKTDPNDEGNALPSRLAY